MSALRHDQDEIAAAIHGLAGVVVLPVLAGTNDADHVMVNPWSDDEHSER